MICSNVVVKLLREVIDISAIHSVKIIPGSKEEIWFTEALVKIGVDREKVLCRPGYLFWKDCDEYIVSNGLYKQMPKLIDKINRSYSRRKHPIL